MSEGGERMMEELRAVTSGEQAPYIKNSMCSYDAFHMVQMAALWILYDDNVFS